MNSDDPIRELIEAYVLDALDDADRERVEQHLPTCADCRRLVKQYTETLAALPRTLASESSMRLPPAIKARLLQRIQAETAPTRPAKTAWPDTLFRQRPAGPWLRTALAAGLTLVLMVVLGWAFELNAALAQERALRAEYATLIGQQEIVFEVLDSNNSTKRFLRPTLSNSTSYGKLWTRTDLASVVVMTGRLPLPPAGQAYYLWLTTGGRLQLAGEIKVNEQGFGMLVFEAERPDPVYDLVQLMLQPKGSTAPGGDILLSWQASP